MDMRVFGRTGMHLSVLGFGCGAVGGLMVRGEPLDQERAVASAIAAGVNYFDTAVLYGNGESEKNLGRVLRNLKATKVIVGTKVRLPSAEFGRIADAVATSLEGSLARLGVIGIRVLAGGALSGSTERHPIASPPPEPIGSAMSYDADVGRSQRLLPLVKEGFAASLTEAATRFAISHSAVGTILVGMATPQQFVDALAAFQKGALPSAALERLSGLQQTFAGELR
jgi:aryl-alcohol dehydrogenase-like predicted oxidoreductase